MLAAEYIIPAWWFLIAAGIVVCAGLVAYVFWLGRPKT